LESITREPLAQPGLMMTFKGPGCIETTCKLQSHHFAHAILLVPFAGGLQRLLHAGGRREHGNHVLALDFPDGERQGAAAPNLFDAFATRLVRHEKHQDGLAQFLEVGHRLRQPQMGVLKRPLQIILRFPHKLSVVHLIERRRCIQDNPQPSTFNPQHFSAQSR
jgi:hypothetical protein